MAGQRTLKINLSKKASNEIRQLSRSSCRSIPEIVRFGLALAKVVVEESAKGNKVILIDPLGEPLKEIILLK